MDELINRLVYHLMDPPLGQAIADDVYIPMMDELLVTPPSDSQVAVAITPTNWNFDQDQPGSYKHWFQGYSQPSTQGEATAAAVVSEEQDDDEVSEGGGGRGR